MMRLVGGLSRPLQVKNLCLQVLQHLCEITQAQHCSLSMTTVDKTGVKCLGPVFQSDEESVYGYTQAEWYKCIMGYVVSTGRPLNIRDACEVINEGYSMSNLDFTHPLTVSSGRWRTLGQDFPVTVILQITRAL